MSPASEQKSPYDKTKIFVGFALMTASFVCVGAVVYLLLDITREKGREADALKEQVVSLNVQEAAAQQKVSQLEEKVGTSVYLNKVITEAEKVYDTKEKDRKEGALWIDRHAGVLYVTLGAMHGLSPGSRVAIYEGRNKIGYVRVETPLDVISYVQPVNTTISDFKNDYYRAVIEP